MLDHCSNERWVGLIADLEDVILRDKVESGPCGLEVVDRLTHITFGGEDERGETFIIVFDLGLAG
jgi:hypothetical protein